MLSLSRFLRRSSTPQPGPAADARPARLPRYRDRRSPGVEWLETRLLLSTIAWTSQTSGNWKDGSNWSGGTAPTSADSVTIDPHKLGPYLSTKGTTEAALTDDRTYVGIALR